MWTGLLGCFFSILVTPAKNRVSGIIILNMVDHYAVFALAQKILWPCWASFLGSVEDAFESNLWIPFGDQTRLGTHSKWKSVHVLWNFHGKIRLNGGRSCAMQENTGELTLSVGTKLDLGMLTCSGNYVISDRLTSQLGLFNGLHTMKSMWSRNNITVYTCQLRGSYMQSRWLPLVS